MSRDSTYDQLEHFFGVADSATAKQGRLYVTLNYDGSNYENCSHNSNTVLNHPIWALMNARNYKGFQDVPGSIGKNLLSPDFVKFIDNVAQHHRNIDQKKSGVPDLAINVGKEIYNRWGLLSQDARDFYQQNINFVSHENPRVATDLPPTAGVMTQYTGEKGVRMNLKKHEAKQNNLTVFGQCIPQLPSNTYSQDGKTLLDKDYLRDIYQKVFEGKSSGESLEGGAIAGIEAWANLDVDKFIKAVYNAQMKSSQRNLGNVGDLGEIYYDMADDKVYSRDANGNLQIKGADGQVTPIGDKNLTTGVPSTIYSCILTGNPVELSRCLGNINDSDIYAAAEQEVRGMNPQTMLKLLNTFVVDISNGPAEHYIQWTSSLAGRLSAKMGSEKGQKTAEAILKNKKLCAYLKRVIDLQRANPALHSTDNADLSDLPQKTLSTKSNLAYFRAPQHINRGDAASIMSRALGVAVQGLNILPQQDMLSIFRPGLQSNLAMGMNPFAGVSGMGMNMGMGLGLGRGQFGGAETDPQAQYLKQIYNTIKDEMKAKGKELVQEDQARIEKAIDEIEKNNARVKRALDDLKAFINLDNVVTNGLGNVVSLNEIKSSTTIPNIRKSISSLESCVNRTSRDQVSLLTALIEQVYRPMLLVASGASTPFIRPVVN